MIVTLQIPLIDWDENEFDAFIESTPLYVRVIAVILLGLLIAWYLFNGSKE